MYNAYPSFASAVHAGGFLALKYPPVFMTQEKMDEINSRIGKSTFSNSKVVKAINAVNAKIAI